MDLARYMVLMTTSRLIIPVTNLIGVETYIERTIERVERQYLNL